MIYKKEINNKLILLDIIDSNRVILENKKEFINQNFNLKDKNEIMHKLKHNLINIYISIKVVKDTRIVFRYEELHKSKTLAELLEVLIVMFENLQEFEVCELLINKLNNI